MIDQMHMLKKVQIFPSIEFNEDIYYISRSV